MKNQDLKSQEIASAKVKYKEIGTVSLLIFLDQIIKVYIYLNYMGKDVDIIENILAFYPIFNKDYSWLNSLFNLGIGMVPHVIFLCFLLVVIILFYDFLKTKKNIRKWLYLPFLALISGNICSLIDKVVWGGSLDYIYLKGFFIFDLKDVYVSIFEVSILLFLIIEYKRFKNFDDKKLLKDFLGFIKEKYIVKHEL